MFHKKVLKNRDLADAIITKLRKSFPDLGPPEGSDSGEDTEIFMAYFHCTIYIEGKKITVEFDLDTPAGFAAEMGLCLSEFKKNLDFIHYDFYIKVEAGKDIVDYEDGEAYIEYGKDLIKQGNSMLSDEYCGVCKDCQKNEEKTKGNA